MIEFVIEKVIQILAVAFGLALTGFVAKILCTFVAFGWNLV